MKGLRLLPHGGILVLSHLLWRSSQHTEYLADRSAASVAGTKAMLGLLDKLQLDATFDLTLQRVAYGLDREQLLDALRRRVRQVPARDGTNPSCTATGRCATRHDPSTHRLSERSGAKWYLGATCRVRRVGTGARCFGGTGGARRCVCRRDDRGPYQQALVKPPIVALPTCAVSIQDARKLRRHRTGKTASAVRPKIHSRSSSLTPASAANSACTSRSAFS